MKKTVVRVPGPSCKQKRMMLKIRPRRPVEVSVLAVTGFGSVDIIMLGAYRAGIAPTAPSLLPDYLQLSEFTVMHVTG